MAKSVQCRTAARLYARSRIDQSSVQIKKDGWFGVHINAQRGLRSFDGPSQPALRRCSRAAHKIEYSLVRLRTCLVQQQVAGQSMSPKFADSIEVSFKVASSAMLWFDESADYCHGALQRFSNPRDARHTDPGVSWSKPQPAMQAAQTGTGPAASAPDPVVRRNNCIA